MVSSSAVSCSVSDTTTSALPLTPLAVPTKIAMPGFTAVILPLTLSTVNTVGPSDDHRTGPGAMVSPAAPRKITVWVTPVSPANTESSTGLTSRRGEPEGPLPSPHAAATTTRHHRGPFITGRRVDTAHV